MTKLARAVEAGRKGNYSQAVKILGEMISGTEAPPEAWLLLGRSFHAQKEHSRALAAFNDYIRLRPESGEGYFFAGRTYLALGLPYKAVPFLRKALERSSGAGFAAARAAEIKALLGTAYLKSKNSLAAADVLKEAVLEAPENRRIYRAYLNSLLVRGIRLCGTDNYNAGLEMLRFVLSNGAESGISGSPFLRLVMGRAARETGNLEEALGHFTAAMELSGSAISNGSDISGGDLGIRWLRASVLMAMGRNAEAGAEIENIRSGDRGIPELPWNSELVEIFLIRSLIEKKQWRKASEVCRNWLRGGKASLPETGAAKPMIHAFYAEAQRNLQNYEAAANHLQRAIEIKPRELEYWYAYILVSWEAGDYRALKKALNTASSLGGDQDIIKRFSILCLARTTKDPFRRLSLLQEAIRSFGPEIELMQSLAEAYLQTGLLDEAISWYKKVISLNKNDENAWLGHIAALEGIYAEDGSKVKGRELANLYKSYLDIWPDNKNILRERALFLVKIADYREALPELEKLLVWEPANLRLRKILAYAYRKTGRYREAAIFLKALLKEKPTDIELLIEYTGCLERAGAAKYAISLLEKARKMFNHSPVNANIAHISLALGILAYKSDDLEKAFDYLREAAALAPGDPRPYEWMAKITKNYGRDSSRYEKEAKARRRLLK